MPLYEYQCQKCGVKEEVIQKFSDPLRTVCSHCGGEVRKLISSPAIKFKGSGFYITDYAKPVSESSAATSEKSGLDTARSEGQSKSGETRSEATKSESAKSESAKSESGKSESTKSEPARSKPAKSESTTSESKAGSK